MQLALSGERTLGQSALELLETRLGMRDAAEDLAEATNARQRAGLVVFDLRTGVPVERSAVVKLVSDLRRALGEAEAETKRIKEYGI